LGEMQMQGRVRNQSSEASVKMTTDDEN
jgi:hypothetical protein